MKYMNIFGYCMNVLYDLCSSTIIIHYKFGINTLEDDVWEINKLKYIIIAFANNDEK